MLSKDLVNNEKDYAKLIWDKVEEIRNSKEYKTIFDEFLKSKN